MNSGVHVLQRLVGRLALVDLGLVGGDDVPLRGARGERVGGDDLDPVLGEVLPGLDALGVALARDEDHDRVADHALRGAGVPVGVDQAGVHQAGHVGLEREDHVVGVEAGLDRPALLAGGGVGLLEAHAGAGGGRLEGLDEVGVDLARHGVAHDRELRSRRRPPAVSAGGAVVATAARGDERRAAPRRGR